MEKINEKKSGRYPWIEETKSDDEKTDEELCEEVAACVSRIIDLTDRLNARKLNR